MGGDDAQNAGVIALHGLQRDIRQSGYGINSTRLLGCNLTLDNGITLNNIGPVIINHPSIPAAARDANTDTVLVIYGNSNGPEEGDGIAAQPDPLDYTVLSQPSYAVGDRVIAQYAQRQSPCALSLDRVNDVPVGGNNIAIGAGVANIMTTNALAGVTPILFNLGQAPIVRVYAVLGGILRVCDYMQSNCGDAGLATDPTVWVPLAANIVSLKAQYGRDTTTPSMDAILDVYDRATPPIPVADITSVECKWSKISALRIALVARGSADKANVTTIAPTWAGSNLADPDPDLIDLSGLATWRNYRYKVFQTTVPIRNVNIQKVVSGC